MKKIAIIGAGISGLFLANLLENDKSFSYKIYEKNCLLTKQIVNEKIKYFKNMNKKLIYID